MFKQDFNYSGVNYALDSEAVSSTEIGPAHIIEVDAIIVDTTDPDQVSVSLGTVWENLEGRTVTEVIPHLTNSRKVYIDYRKKGDDVVILGNVDEKGIATLEKFADEVANGLPEVPEGFSGWWRL